MEFTSYPCLSGNGGKGGKGGSVLKKRLVRLMIKLKTKIDPVAMCCRVFFIANIFDIILKQRKTKDSLFIMKEMSMNVFDALKAELKQYLYVISKCIQTADHKVDPVFLNQLPSCVEKIVELAKCFFGTEFEKEIRNIAKISSLLRDELFKYYNDGYESEIEYALVLYPKITSLIYAFSYLEELKNNANNLRFIVINHKSCLGVTLMVSYPDFKENFEERVAVIRPGEFGYFITATPEDNITLHFRYKESFADDFTKYETITLDNLHPGFNVFSFGNNPMENNFSYKITSDADNKFLKLIGKDPELL